MEATTVDGTAVNAATGLGGRQIIGKTGTTSNEHFRASSSARSRSTRWSSGCSPTSRTPPPTAKDSLALLGGGGFGGFWPANIWNTFAQAEFANLTAENFQSPQFSGAAVEHDRPAAEGEAEEAHPQVHGDGPRQVVPGSRQGLPVGDADADAEQHAAGRVPDFPVRRRRRRRRPLPDVDVNRHRHRRRPRRPALPRSPVAGTAAAIPPQTASGVKAGMAVGGLLAALLPGSLLWTTASRRRREAGRGPARAGSLR